MRKKSSLFACILLAWLPNCQPFGGLVPRDGWCGAGQRLAKHSFKRGETSLTRCAGVLSARMGGGGGREGQQGTCLLEGFDSVTGYGDMTGVAKFDDAWVEAYRRKDR